MDKEIPDLVSEPLGSDTEDDAVNAITSTLHETVHATNPSQLPAVWMCATITTNVVNLNFVHAVKSADIVLIFDGASGNTNVMVAAFDLFGMPTVDLDGECPVDLSGSIHITAVVLPISMHICM